ncbi:helix-turn-helix domain-containing protein [Celeribacter indicus]|uniref:Helix-turn-helix domain-containing protein n=1 Tax=Celeribacter indicus TaxID=1208324 RepID=A0A0B5DTD7_9RHOB|nr:helix-turn-helix domain-containing protein [Celeribacter indicus]AJE46693.1 helix-turn-helix domain-containing protein [Celeribacter indicus]SDX54253.1 transcriptional regulator, AraC family [Celeribacter indicus]
MKREVHLRSATDKNTYRDLISSVFASYDLRFSPNRQFSAEVKCVDIRDFKFARVHANNQLGVRQHRQVEKDQKDELVLFTSLSGTIHLTQNNREVTVRPGELGLYDLGSPSIWKHGDPTAVLNLVLPGEVLRRRLSGVSRTTSFPYVVSSGVSRLSHGFFVGLWNEVEAISSFDAELCTGYLADLLALSIERGEKSLPLNRPSARRALYHRSIAFIRSHLEDPDLDPQGIAEAVGISVRYLHQIFEEAGQSVCACLRDARLERGHAELSRPRTLAYPISEIARRSGFRNPSHFATAFKRRYGLSPREQQNLANSRED